MRDRNKEKYGAKTEMENKKGKYKLVIILVACVAAVATGVRLHWGEDVGFQKRHHKIKRMEIPKDTGKEWTEAETEAAEQILKKRYGDELERVSVETEYADTGEKITVVTYWLPGTRTADKGFYFQVKSGLENFDNFPFQLMKNDAQRFFNGKNRAFGLYSPDDGVMYDASDTRWDTESCPGETDMLYVSCYREEDIDSCAADIADWLIYAAGDERYFLQNGMVEGKETDPFRNIWIITPKSHYRIAVNEAVDKIKEEPWEEVQRAVARAIVETDGAYHIWETDGSDGTKDGGEGGTESASEEEWEKEFFERYQGDFERECELEDGRIRYRMVVLDAAAGSRWYGLLKSKDRGISWKVVSSSPFGGDMGMGIEFTFLDETLGFATLSHNGGDEADLYVTENGGESYQRAVIQGLEVTLEDGYLYNPYDFPQMPYEENGKLYVLCGQGADGDYDGGDAAGMALFESTDGGHIFSYKEIRKGEEE